MMDMDAYVARDKNGRLYLYLRKPKKNVELWAMPDLSVDFLRLSSKSFPEVKWSDDEPMRVKITIEK